MGYRLVNLNENGFSPFELQEINNLASKKQLSIVVQRALKQYFENNLVVASAPPLVLSTVEEVETYIKDYRKRKPDATNLTEKLMSENLLKKIADGKRIIIDRNTGEMKVEVKV